MNMNRITQHDYDNALAKLDRVRETYEKGYVVAYLTPSQHLCVEYDPKADFRHLENYPVVLFLSVADLKRLDDEKIDRILSKNLCDSNCVIADSF